MFCPNCGNQIPDDSTFCQNCGARLGTVQQPQGVQTPYQQPMQQPQYAQQSKPKSKKRIIFIVIAVIAVYGVLHIINAIVNKDEPPAEYRPNQITDVTVTPPPASSNVSGSPWDVPAQTGGTTNHNPGSGASTNTNPSTSTSQPQGSGGAASTASYSTDELPQEAEFDWFYDNLDKFGASLTPNTAEFFDDSVLLEGGWKVTIFRTNEAGDSYQKEFQHFDVTVSGDTIEADVKWSGLISPDTGDVWRDGSDISPNHYTGTVEHSAGHLRVHLTDYYDDKIDLYSIYLLGGRQYAIGSYLNPRDTVQTQTYVAFFRP
ncbi:MAG: zinc-ribbon domain-containing protein [Ruminococcaceae bacterium]|nr:zinc-ribbon domain-containing protein [Oscillospiraceae bacterium]